jgi:hypothetical protein
VVNAGHPLRIQVWDYTQGRAVVAATLGAVDRGPREFLSLPQEAR